MGRTCEATGKGTTAGNSRSHANGATKRTFRVNLHRKKLRSESLDVVIEVRVSAAALRSIDKLGLDTYLLKVDPGKLSEPMLRLRARIEAKTSRDGSELIGKGA